MYEVLDLTGTEIKTLQTEYIDKGMPVIFWACINMREPITGPQWKLKDSGEVFTWISNEHCMLLVGYDEEGYYFNDPYENNGVIRYPKEIVEDRYKAQHMQAVAVKRNKEGQASVDRFKISRLLFFFYNNWIPCSSAQL